ncbi:MAG: sialidase family protein [Gammaproteobacteria bacterium]
MRRLSAVIPQGLILLACNMVLVACGGGGSSSSGTTPSGPDLTQPAAPLVRVTGNSPYAANCGGASSGGVSYEDAEVEPYEAVNPANPSNVIGVWQQDRWSDGGAHGLVAGYSMDGGKTWKEQPLALSVCGGGNVSNSANYGRASDPWVSFSPDGTAYAISISFSGDTLAPGSSGGVLVVRSADGGASWSGPTVLIADGPSAFNDKESITADPNDSHYAYAVWDRLTVSDTGATNFSRTTDGGTTWEAAKPIYDPGVDNQTIGNEVVGLTDGSIVDVFEEIDGTSGNAASGNIRLVRSTDHGATWSTPVTVAADLSVGTFDPDTGMSIRAGAALPPAAAAPGGGLVVVWQDGRFSNGQRDDIALARSTDGGLTWSQPVEVNSVHSTPAFTPSVAILTDGTIGVSYFDFRKNTPDKTTLPTDYWFTSSTDGVHWSEQHISGSFDLDLAPDAEGLFLGDYQALSAIGNAFVPFYVQTSDAGTADRNDAYFLPPQPKPLTLLHEAVHVASVAGTAGTLRVDAAFRSRIHENLMHLLRGENPGWDKVVAARRSTARTTPSSL